MTEMWTFNWFPWLVELSYAQKTCGLRDDCDSCEFDVWEKPFLKRHLEVCQQDGWMDVLELASSTVKDELTKTSENCDQDFYSELESL